MISKHCGQSFPSLESFKPRLKLITLAFEGVGYKNPSPHDGDGVIVIPEDVIFSGTKIMSTHETGTFE